MNHLDKNKLIFFLQEMLLIRRFEEKAAYLYGLGKFGGFCHLYIGQEAVSVGSIGAIDLNKDYVITAYRDHGHAISCQIPLNEIMAELYGKSTGCSKGKGGSMHLFKVKNHMYGGHGIVGSHIPLATGMAFKLKYMKEDGVVLCYFGDGAIHMGTFHESLNLAKLWDLPILYICENNEYGMGTYFKRVSSVDNLSIKGLSYDIQSFQVNGMDVIEVYNKVSECLNEVRSGNPIFLEIKTYRYKGHSMSDPARYRTPEELLEYKVLDPILKLKNYLIAEKYINEAYYNEMDEEINKNIELSVKFAEESEDSSVDEAYEDIYN